MNKPVIFVVTDIEADGPDPGRHSMLSFASVARGEEGQDCGEFSINLMPLPDAEHDHETMQWWKTYPLAWEQTTKDQIDPAMAMRAWVSWVQSLPGAPVFAAHPLSFDGAWIDWYLQKFVGRRLFYRPRDPGLCSGAGIDIPSLVMATMGWEYQRCNREHYPETWLGGHEHSHCALHDARGYAHLLTLILNRNILGRLAGTPRPR